MGHRRGGGGRKKGGRRGGGGGGGEKKRGGGGIGGGGGGGGVFIGNYCSIGPNLNIFRANHPMDYFTTHPLFYNPVFGHVKKDTLQRPGISIGHDVWIGANVVILPGCKTIGNGVVIGAGSVVTKDIPSYAIAAGNPARVIKTRFSQAVIKRLEKSQWWKLSRDELTARKMEYEDIITSGEVL